MENQLCFECLQQRIQTDFSDKLLVCYGISDSALPFGYKAVCQIALSNGVDKTSCMDVSTQFLLVTVENHKDECLRKHIEGYIVENVAADSKWVKDSMITALAPVASVGIGSYTAVEDLAYKFVSGSVEDHIILSLNSLIEGKPTSGDGKHFLSLVGIPPIAWNYSPKRVRHPNIAPVLGMLKMPECISLLYPKAPYTLENILHYSPMALKSDWHIRFLIYQILSALMFIHSLGIAHGNLRPSSVMLIDSYWCWLSMEHQLSKLPLKSEGGPMFCSGEYCPCQALHADLKLSPSMDWHSDFKRWWSGELSNYDYLLLLNRLAGRRWDDHTFHMVMPWVIDFSVKPDENSDTGWRDLRKSKWRLAKGDEQLDFTYLTSEIPHHVSDECLSELAVCSYKARRLPLSVLRAAVRSVYEPNEYPSNMQRLYQWTPDECIPEFYSDPRIFSSRHSGMSDLAVPSWVSSPEEFISLHRAALESDRVSMQIHHWIDITFGYKMSGEASISAKNVMLPASEPSTPKSTGRRQLFTRPHPMRRQIIKNVHSCSKESVQNGFLEELEGAALFCEHGRHLTPCYKLPPEKVVEEIFAEEPVENGEFESALSETSSSVSLESFDIDLSSFLEYFEGEDDDSVGFQEFLLWKQKSLHQDSCSEDIAGDIFSVGCILAELYLKKPLFNSLSLAAYTENGLLPGLMKELPPYAEQLIESCIELDWRRYSIASSGVVILSIHVGQPIHPTKLEPFERSTVYSACWDEWWMNFGIEDLELQNLAIRILSQTCSSSGCERNWIVFERIHTKRRNRLEHKRLNDLVYTHYNLHLKEGRPSVKSLLESPYFPSTVRSAYLFLSPLHLLAKTGPRLRYAANLARGGALKMMGTFAAEMCAPYCLPLIMDLLSDFEAESALYLLKEFLKCLKSEAIKMLILPPIQRILQSTDYSHLKVSLLQNSFVREIWKQLGRQTYLDKIHPLVISNLYISPHKNSASAASVLLIGSCEELGVPVTVHQTILPLIHCFGKGLVADGLDALVRIGGLLGENFVVRQLLPLLQNVVSSCIDLASIDKPEPLQSWNALALIDCLVALDGLVAILPRDVVLKELVQDQICSHVKVLVQTHLDLTVLQVAAATIISVCRRIGPDLTAFHILPQLKDLFDELAFSQESISDYGSVGKNLRISRSILEASAPIESRMDLVLLLYPPLASLLSIERLRQCCSTWFLLEQFLQRHHSWKWEYTGETSRALAENPIAQRPIFSKISPSQHNPTKLLLNGVGWSIPQSQGIRSGKTLMSYKKPGDLQPNLGINYEYEGMGSFGKREPWFWFPSPADSWDGPDFLARVGKDEFPWKIRASILCSVRAHPGALRSLAVVSDECTVFSGGVGPGFRGTVQKWDISRMACVSGYFGHEEVVNDICILSTSGRVASCDGTIHVWNSQSGKLITAYAEPSANSSLLSNSLSTALKVNAEHANVLNSTNISGGILSTAFSGSVYTSMHHLDSDDKLIAGLGNGSLRFIDVASDQKLHLWKSEAIEPCFSSLVSAICSCGSEKLQQERGSASSSWIAAGLGSGHCKILDSRSGNIIAFWRAHDGFITKLAAPEDHLLVSSSLDKTLRVWDLRRNWPSQLNHFRGHSDGISSFSVWGQDVISVSRNKIGLSSLSRPGDEHEGQQWISPQKLYSADRGMRNLSVLSSISILPFSRLFLVGTEDGYLKMCC